MSANETRLRTLMRALSWRVTGVLLAVFLTWLITGDLRTGLEVGLAYNVIRFGTQYLHDRWWAGIAWGTLHHEHDRGHEVALKGDSLPRTERPPSKGQER
jgi:uncharacterized membrane protein